MRTPTFKLLGIALAAKAKYGAADCSDKSPDFEDNNFQFPAYGGIDGESGSDSFSKSPYRDCASPADFYEQEFPVVYCTSDDDDDCTSFDSSCDVLTLTNLNVPPGTGASFRTAFNNNLRDGAVEVPDDDTDCCEALRFKDDEIIAHEIEADFCVKINITEEYGSENASTFQSLCEELYVCTQYVDQYGILECGDGRGCRDNEYPSLCFDEAYDPDAADEEIYLRTEFIVGSCYGAGGNEFDFEAGAYEKEDGKCDADDDGFTATSLGLGVSIDGLQETRDSICNYARDLNDRLNFVPINTTICDELIACIVDQANDLFDEFGVDEEVTPGDFDEYDLCNYDTEEELEEAKVQRCEGANSSPPGYSIPQGEGGCRTLPVCPSNLEGFFTSFGPDYPGDDEYQTAVASITGTNLAIENGFDNRTTADYVGLIGILRATAEGVVIATEALVSALPDDVIYVWKYNPFFYASLTYGAFDAVYEQTSLHDGLVDSAEIEAAYENSRQLLDGSAAIYDEVVCRCREAPRRGHGCDSVDNNCNQTVDECDEENFPPEIDIGQSVVQCGSGSECCGKREVWFQSDEDAISCVLNAAEVKDDCDPSVQEVEETLNGTCYAATIALDAMDKCGNDATTKVVPVHIDLEDPTVWCNFGGEVDTILQETGIGVQTEMNLSYGASDNCGGPLEVTVSIYANEIEDFQSQKMALLYTNTGNMNNEADLYLASTTCSTAANGQCIKEDGFYDNRLYTADISAIDPSGRTAVKATCTALVLKKNNTDPIPDISESSQRFHLASYTSTFTDYDYEESELI